MQQSLNFEITPLLTGGEALLYSMTKRNSLCVWINIYMTGYPGTISNTNKPLESILSALQYFCADVQ
jgi:hypothetical protein